MCNAHCFALHSGLLSSIMHRIHIVSCTYNVQYSVHNGLLGFLLLCNVHCAMFIQSALQCAQWWGCSAWWCTEYTSYTVHTMCSIQCTLGCSTFVQYTYKVHCNVHSGVARLYDASFPVSPSCALPSISLPPTTPSSSSSSSSFSSYSSSTVQSSLASYPCYFTDPSFHSDNQTVARYFLGAQIAKFYLEVLGGIRRYFPDNQMVTR